MKVVVCFDSVRVTVPCGEGEIPVKELVNKAVHRYKRAVGKGTDHWVEVSNLKTISGGGILDPDDLLCDVVDDREQLIAEFEEQNRPRSTSLGFNNHPHPINGGDGASASSTGTTSPEPFSLSGSSQHHHHLLPIIPHHAPGDSVSSSSSSAVSAPPVPSVPHPQTSASAPLIQPLSSIPTSPEQTRRSPSAFISAANVGTRQDSSSSNNNPSTEVVVVTPRDLSLGSKLRVRRGSESNLAALLENVASSDNHQITAGNLRSFHPRRESVRDSDEPRSDSSDEEKHIRFPMTNSLDRKKIGMARFTRDSLRSSLSSQTEMYRWLEAQQRAEKQTKEKKLIEERTGLEQCDGGDEVSNNAAQQNSCLIRLQNDGGPLGIHAVPAQDKNGLNTGLLIQSVEPNRPVQMDGRIQPSDVIVEINGTSIHGVPFLKAQEIFRAAMDTEEISLKIVKGSSEQKHPCPNDKETNHSSSTLPELPAKRKPAPQPPPVMPKPRHHAPLKPSPLAAEVQQSSIFKPGPVPAPRNITPEPSNPNNTVDPLSTKNNSSDDTAPNVKSNCGNKTISAPSSSSSTTNTAVSGQTPDLLVHPPKKTSVIKPGPPIKAPKPNTSAPALPARIPNTPSSSAPQIPSSPPAAASSSVTSTATDAPINAVFNTRRIGKKIVINLRKGPAGLGFSVTSRDNQTGGDCPIYIRNILPKGAAVQDGQLRSGDRLLQVNGVEMTGKTQPEAVSFLRTLVEGSLVELIVSRQEEVDEKFKVPRKMVEASVEEVESQEPITVMDHQGHDKLELDDDVNAVFNDNVDKGDDVLLQYPSQSLDSIDGVVSPKEVLTLRIPLNDTGSAGLGVSVKGKTQSSPAGLRDLGIFVKTVLQGGAAYKDGRLKVNDQLLDVNGIQLEGKPNTVAMEALRSAMIEEGNSGFITLSVLRRSPNTTPLSPTSKNVSDSSATYGLMDTQLANAALAAEYKFAPNNQKYHNYYQPNPRGAHGSPVIHHRSSSASDALNPQAAIEKFGAEGIDMPSPIPPARSKRVAALRERFQSESQGNGLRNESYTQATNQSMVVSPQSKLGNNLRNESYARATHDSLNDSGTFSQVQHSHPQRGNYQDVKENIPVADQDHYTLPHKLQRPHSTIGFLHGQRASYNSDEDAFVRSSIASSKEESDLSPGLDIVAPFAREGFGRQSMSEKRKGHLDPRTTETYKMVKAQKENKDNTAGATNSGKELQGLRMSPLPPWPPVQIAKHAPPNEETPSKPATSTASVISSSQETKPNLVVHDTENSSHQASKSAASDQPSGMKKSSSVEDLTNTGQNIVSSSSSGVHQNRDTSPMCRQTRFGRTRACNDSFRAAVDRSYDALDPALMDTLEEESAESGAFTLDPSNSGRSSISSDNPEDTNSLKRRKAKEKEKKGGLLKGFLRFGKGRKSNEEAMRRSRSEERPGQRNILETQLDETDAQIDPATGWERSVGGQPFGDNTKLAGFVPLTDYSGEIQPQQRGRRLSKPEQERMDEDYAKMRSYQSSQQRLRSQSVDPSHHRHASLENYIDREPFSGHRSSPFQPFSSSSTSFSNNRGTVQQDFYKQGMDSYHSPNSLAWYEKNQAEIDPRQFHPAATGYRQTSSSSFDNSSGKQYFPEMIEQVEDKRPPLAKAVLSRAEYIQQLRSLYQEKHRLRQGVYPLDDAEEKYERQIQEMEKTVTPFNTDVSRDPHLLRFTDRPPSRQIEQHRSERTLSTSNISNNNTLTNSTSYGSANSSGRKESNNYAYHQHSLPHTRGTAYDQSSNYSHYHQPHRNYQNDHNQPNPPVPIPSHHPHHRHQQYNSQQYQQQYNTQGYNFSPSMGYNYPSSPRDNGSAGPYRHPSFTSYPHNDQFYHGQPQSYRGAPSQYSQHRSTTPYSDPTSAKV